VCAGAVGWHPYRLVMLEELVVVLVGYASDGVREVRGGLVCGNDRSEGVSDRRMGSTSSRCDPEQAEGH
jgi:hypothetical protein